MGLALGQPFMPWQRQVAEVACEIDPVTGLPAYREVIVTVPRQSGKTTLFLSWQIHRCQSPRWSQPQRSVFTAQTGKDARDKWLDELFPLIRRSKKLRPLYARIYEGMGNEYIRWKNGSLIRLLSTSTSSGHSKTLHQAVLDEVWHDEDSRREQGLRPAMITIPDAQLLVCSTAGTHRSLVLNRKMASGRDAVQRDLDSGIAYIEYSAPDDWDPDDEESYYGFMPALCPDPPCRCGDGSWRHTVTMAAVRAERQSMEPDDFARAYGNRPQGSSRSEKLPSAIWDPLADRSSTLASSVAFAVEIARDWSWASIAAAGRRADGRGHGEVFEYRPGTDWLIPRMQELTERWNPCAWVLDPASPAGALIKAVDEAGIRTKCACHGELGLHLVSAREKAQACGALFDACINDQFRHLNQPHLNTAATKAVIRLLDDAWVWSRKDSSVDISPLWAVTLAKFGFDAHGTAEVEDVNLWGVFG